MQVAKLPPLLTMRDLSIPSFQELTENFTADPRSIEVSLAVPDVLAQWVAGLLRAKPLPKVGVSVQTLDKLRSLLPDLRNAPSLIMVNISSPYFRKPTQADNVTADLPVHVIPDHMISNVSQLLPDLTSLPSLLVPAGLPNNITLPVLTLPAVTLPSLQLQLSHFLTTLPEERFGVSHWLGRAGMNVTAPGASSDLSTGLKFESGTEVGSDFGFAELLSSQDVVPTEALSAGVEQAGASGDGSLQFALAGPDKS